MHKQAYRRLELDKNKINKEKRKKKLLIHDPVITGDRYHIILVKMFWI